MLYNDGNIIIVGFYACFVGFGIITGQVVGGCLAEPIGHTRYQCMVVITCGGALLAGCACVTPDNKATVLALMYSGCFCIGWNETLCLANATILVKDQKEIGAAGGVAGSVRAFISAICVAVYATVLTNRLTTTISTQVPAALVAAGLPASSVVQFLGAFTIGTPAAFEAVPGATADIIAIGARAYKVANADAFSTVYLTSLAFTGVAIILTWFAPNTDDLMSSKVAATLHNENDTIARIQTHEEKV